METLLLALIPILLLVLILRLLLLPMNWVLRTAAHAGGGFLCLWILNMVSGLTKIYIPYNAVTISAAGFLGVPGILLLGAIELFL